MADARPLLVFLPSQGLQESSTEHSSALPGLPPVLQVSRKEIQWLLISESLQPGENRRWA